MSWLDALSDVINRYKTSSPGGAATAPADPHRDFCEVAKTAPTEVTADALAHVFRSDQTPSFPEMVGNLFRESNPDQRAGLLNQLAGCVSPGLLSAIPGLSELLGGGGKGQQLTPQQASQVSPEQVQQAADHCERANPAIVEQVSRFYAEHPGVVKALGGAAIAMALQHVSRRR
jgi:hypothetical protein